MMFLRVRGVDLIVVTIPEKNIPSLPAGLFADTPDHVVVVDTGNYYPRQRDGRIEEIEAGLTESQWVAQQLGRPVIKAFNNIYARHLLELGRPMGSPGRIALPVAGDDKEAKAIVLKLVDELGFDGVDAGGLDQSWATARHASLHQGLRRRGCAGCSVRRQKRPYSGMARHREQSREFHRASLSKSPLAAADLKLAGPLLLPGKTLKFRVDPQLVAHS